MELWYTEKQTENFGITCKITETLHTEKTEFQELAVIETKQFGRMLTLDGMVMTTLKDEFVYHEMISHVPLFAHENPKKVLVIGGGDGGVIREVLKHKSVEKAVLVEIDKAVIDASKKFFPEISCGLEDKRVEVLTLDGIEYIKNHKNEFDVILVDSTEPIGPAEGLFALDFYKSIYDALKEDGILTAQTESPFFNQELIKRVFKDINSVFPITKLYLCSIPTYPSGLWSFTAGSKKYDPACRNDLSSAIDTKYYTNELHKAVFALPKFVKDLIS